MSPDPALYSALARSEDSLSRLDERVRSSPLGPGWSARMAFHEAAAWRYLQGDLVHLEDLVLHDGELDQRMPDPTVLAAHAALRRRRKAALLHAEDLRQWPVARSVLGLRRVDSSAAAVARAAGLAAAALRPEPAAAQTAIRAPSPPPGLLDHLALPVDLNIDTDEAAFLYWASGRPNLAEWPLLLGTAIRLDLWAQLEPLPRSSDLGDLIVEADLRAAKRLRSAMLLVEVGRRNLQRRGRHWRQADPPSVRLCYWLDAIFEGAQAGLAEMDALAIARQRFDRILSGKRSSSRLGDLAELLLRSPIVTAAQGAQALGVSQQAVRTLIGDLKSVVREVTGRKSFRAWRI